MSYRDKLKLMIVVGKRRDNVFLEFLHHHETLDIQWFFIFVDEYFSCALAVIVV